MKKNGSTDSTIKIDDTYDLNLFTDRKYSGDGFVMGPQAFNYFDAQREIHFSKEPAIYSIHKIIKVKLGFQITNYDTSEDDITIPLKVE